MAHTARGASLHPSQQMGQLHRAPLTVYFEEHPTLPDLGIGGVLVMKSLFSRIISYIHCYLLVFRTPYVEPPSNYNFRTSMQLWDAPEFQDGLCLTRSSKVGEFSLPNVRVYAVWKEWRSLIHPYFRSRFPVYHGWTLWFMPAQQRVHIAQCFVCVSDCKYKWRKYQGLSNTVRETCLGKAGISGYFQSWIPPLEVVRTLTCANVHPPEQIPAS